MPAWALDQSTPQLSPPKLAGVAMFGFYCVSVTTVTKADHISYDNNFTASFRVLIID